MNTTTKSPEVTKVLEHAERLIKAGEQHQEQLAADIRAGRISGSTVEGLAELGARVDIALTIKRLVRATKGDRAALTKVILERALRTDSQPGTVTTSPGENLLRAVRSEVWDDFARRILGI
jgi:hypothetical protein